MREGVAQFEDFVDDGTVVPFSRIRPLVRGAGGVGAVDFLAQGAVVAAGNDGAIARIIQGEAVALLALAFRRFFGGGEVVFGQALERLGAGDGLAPAHVGVQHILLKLRGEFGEALADVAIRLLLVRRQADAGEAEIAQRIGNGLLLRRSVRGEGGGFFQLDKALIERLMLAEPGAVIGDFGERGVVCLAQRVAVFDVVQMDDDAPGAVQLVGGIRQRHEKIVPIGRGDGGDFFDLLVVMGDEEVDSGGDVRRGESAEFGQAAEIKQRVVFQRFGQGERRACGIAGVGETGKTQRGETKGAAGEKLTTVHFASCGGFRQMCQRRAI